MPEVTLRHSTYDPNAVEVGIVHIGLGAFHRAHQAMFVEHWLNRNGGGNWGISAANIRSNKQIVEQLNSRGCRYKVVAYRDSSNVIITEVNAIREAIYAGDNSQKLIDRLVSPVTRIVTLTVTEKGYCFIPAKLSLRTDDADLQHDLLNPTQPKTVPGILLAAIVRRRANNVQPFAVLSCDNMPENGKMLQHAVVQLAALKDKALADWIVDNVAFPCSMVDQIVPAVDDEIKAALGKNYGIDDPGVVVTEEYSQWVIEDNFPAGRPDWQKDGVQMVADVAPFETMKLRLLNGSHSLIAYLGCLMGWETVSEAMDNQKIRALVKCYMGEVIPTLNVPENLDLDEYCERLLMRFSNDSLNHRLQQIAMDGSQKILQRWLVGALHCLNQNMPFSVTALAVAAWIRYTKGVDFNGRTYQVFDPMAARFSAIHEQKIATATILDSLFSISEVFPQELIEKSHFKDAVLLAYQSLVSNEGVDAIDAALTCQVQKVEFVPK